MSTKAVLGVAGFGVLVAVFELIRNRPVVDELLDKKPKGPEGESEGESARDPDGLVTFEDPGPLSGPGKLRPGESMGPDGRITDAYERITEHKFSFIKAHKCARKIAMGRFSPTVQHELRRFYGFYNRALNQEVDCDGMTLAEAEIEGQRKAFEALLPAELR